MGYLNKEHRIKEWGVLGLGYRPGSSCVNSIFRLNKGIVKARNEKFLERLKKCIHEIGHNLDLHHCTSKRQCLIKETSGLFSKVDMETLDFCKSCKKKLGMVE